MPRPTTVLVALGAGLVLVAGCTGGHGSNGAAGGGGLTDQRGTQASGDATAGGARSAAQAPSPQAADHEVALTPTSLVITATVEVTVRRGSSVDAAAARATALAAQQGGRVDSDDRSGRGAGRTATLVLRVPNDAVPTVKSRLAVLGTATSQRQTTQDVTDEVTDVASRVRSARDAIAGLRRLYARATTVQELISVETSLAARQGDLEALEARQAQLQRQTSLATVTVTLSAPAAPAAARGGGFLGGLRDGWDAFTAAVGAVATGIGAALPFLVVLLALGAVAWRVVRRRRPAPPVDA